MTRKDSEAFDDGVQAGRALARLGKLPKDGVS